MKNGTATKKVVGGKLLRVKTQFEVYPDIQSSRMVESVQLTGDFFLHPEDAVSALEKSLVGLPVDADRGVFLERLNAAIQESGAQLVGFSADDIVDTLLESLQNK